MPLAAAMLTPSAKQGKGTTLLLVLLLQRITEMLAVELALPRFDDGGSLQRNFDNKRTMCCTRCKVT